MRERSLDKPFASLRLKSTIRWICGGPLSASWKNARAVGREARSPPLGPPARLRPTEPGGVDRAGRPGGPLRRGATKVATGHNLDDEAQSIMMNYLKGDVERLWRLRPRRPVPGLVPRIKPLQNIPEREVALYGFLGGFYPESEECPYAHSSFRFDIRNMMNGLERIYPGTKRSVISGVEIISKSRSERPPTAPLARCKICGEPCVKDLCKACTLLTDRNDRSEKRIAGSKDT